MPAKKRRRIRAVVSVSFESETADLIEHAAKLRHEKKSVFIRGAAVELANRILGIEPATQSAHAVTTAAAPQQPKLAA